MNTDMVMASGVGGGGKMNFIFFDAANLPGFSPIAHGLTNFEVIYTWIEDKAYLTSLPDDFEYYEDDNNGRIHYYSPTRGSYGSTDAAHWDIKVIL